MPQFDLVILGAGPAGTAAAVTACALGLSVALVDKARFPRDKLCGGLVTGRCARHLAAVFGPGTGADLFDTCRDFEFHMNNAPLGRLQDMPPAHLTMRRDFDNLLFSRALAAGAADFTGRRVAALDLPGNRVRLRTGETLHYGCLIGADGVQSITARALFGAPFDTRRIGFALEIEHTAAPASAGQAIRIDFAAANWGYGWAFPKRSGTTIGLGGIHARNPVMKARLAAYLDMLGVEPGAAIKGHFLPFGGYRNRPGRGNVLLAGDAAGFVDPLTGEGIGHAIHSGALAAQAASEALATDRPDSAATRYRHATRPIRRALRMARLLRPLVFARSLAPLFSAGFAASRSVRRDYIRLLAGEIDYGPILTRTARRLPGAVLRWGLRRGPYRGRPGKQAKPPDVTGF